MDFVNIRDFFLNSDKFLYLPSLKHRKDLKRSESIIFVLFCLFSIVGLFKNAYSISFFLDDFFFLDIGHANNLWQFLNFFSPFKNYFYRPIPTETFYFIINYFGQDLIIAHTIVFVVYIIGVFYLLKITFFITQKRLFSYLLVFFYAINTVHIFQLYQLATFIEIALFTFLIVSFYYFITQKIFISLLFFIIALMSKETALLYPIFLFAYTYFTEKVTNNFIKLLGLMFFISIIFLLIYHQSSQTAITTTDTYTIQLNPHLLLNNTVWYLLWSLGLPNFVPDYIKSIFFNPLPSFWNLMTDSTIRHYFYLLIAYFALFVPTYIVVLLRANNIQQKKILILTGFGLFFFLVFISPNSFGN